MMQRTGPIGPAAPATSWKVTSQVAQLGTGPDGRPAEGYRVMFTTGKGASGYVFVPYDLYSAANVEAMIRPHAQELDQVQDMSRGMPPG
jgi:hypothetical protein